MEVQRQSSASLRRIPLAVLVTLFLSAAAFAQSFADHSTMAPVTGASRLAASVHAMPQNEAANYVASVERVHVIDAFVGLNAALRQEAGSNNKMMVIGRGLEVTWEADKLFGDGAADAGYTSFSAAIVSADAHGIRVQVNLSGLTSADELWLIDPTGPRAFGPFGADDHVEDGRWLPLVDGDTAVLVARTTAAVMPNVEVVRISHVYRDLDAVVKELSCNINIACETNETLLDLATGVGIMVLPFGNGDQALCSGALINNPDTAEYEPYYLTANHCVPGAASASQIDIVWDYRASACGTNDPSPLSILPRSNGIAMLVTDNRLDMTLLQLDQVPSGPFGRTFLGWDTGTPQSGDPIVSIHHPEGTHMRISKGSVTAADQSAGAYTNQTLVQWTEGVTEPGSSGNPLLSAPANYRIIGVLSNGPFHSCVDTSGNTDFYASFRTFFDEAEIYLKSANPPPAPSGCAATKVFSGDADTLEQLRAFRDQVLDQSAPGKLAILAYYTTSKDTARWVEESRLARTTFRLAARPFAMVGAWIQHRK